jgi:imidazolonepropionase-like amidohydrolase
MESAGEAYDTDDEPPALAFCPNCAEQSSATSGGSFMSGTDDTPQASTLFRNVRVFDGSSETLSDAMDVLVRDATIGSILPASGAVPDDIGTVVLDGGGRVLMPGLIDAHWHTMVATSPLAVFITVDVGYLNHVAARDAERTLMRGFTTVRDAGGPSFGLKRAIDEGIVAGPRIYPSGAFISQTGGHGDFRMPYAIRRLRSATWRGSEARRLPTAPTRCCAPPESS